MDLVAKISVIAVAVLYKQIGVILLTVNLDTLASAFMDLLGYACIVAGALTIPLVYKSTCH